MTTELDPKLREFETKLRQLKPLAVASRNEQQPIRAATGRSRLQSQPSGCGSDSLSSPGGRRPIYRIAAYALATATAATVIVWLTPQPQPLPVLPQVEPTIVAVVAVPTPLPTASPTMRQQLAALLDEMNVADPIAETKPVYPVVEIVVCDAPPKATVPLPVGTLAVSGGGANTIDVLISHKSSFRRKPESSRPGITPVSLDSGLRRNDE